MSNVKSVNIVALVPFNWMDNMEAEEASFVGKTLLTPSIGIDISFTDAGFRKHEGGQTAMYLAKIQGHEALRWEWFDHLRGIIEKVGDVGVWEVVDIEA